MNKYLPCGAHNGDTIQNQLGQAVVSVGKPCRARRNGSLAQYVQYHNSMLTYFIVFIVSPSRAFRELKSSRFGHQRDVQHNKGHRYIRLGLAVGNVGMCP
jgi:hypothetical protein